MLSPQVSRCPPSFLYSFLYFTEGRPDVQGLPCTTRALVPAQELTGVRLAIPSPDATACAVGDGLGTREPLGALPGPTYPKPYATFVEGIVARQVGCRAIAVTNVPPGCLP